MAIMSIKTLEGRITTNPSSVFLITGVHVVGYELRFDKDLMMISISLLSNS